MTLLALATIALCLKAGLWQYDKAASKQALQTQLSARLAEPPVALPSQLADLKTWRYKRVKFAGVYDTRYQVLLDNQVENTVTGYHVLTPMQVEGSQLYVLVNRGWIAAMPYKMGVVEHALPQIITPPGRQVIEGDIGLPATKFFTLEAPPASDGKWQPVWQHLDMARYAKSVPYATQPFIVRLNPQNSAGGYVRNWPVPGAKVTMHLGYAYQWFGFALTLLVIYMVLNIKKVER
jgi:surfeit locus 1 family protein